MTNEQIAANVREIAKLILRDAPMKPGEQAAVDGGVALITNLLQNINTIAAAAKDGVFDQ